MVEFEPKIEQKIPEELPELPFGVVKLEVYEYLNLSQKDIALGALKVNNIMNYCDLYYVKEYQFKNIIIQNNLVNYYKEITGESMSHISKKGIKKFAIKIGIDVKNRDELHVYILDELKKKGITLMNELLLIPVSNIVEYFKSDNIFRYYFRKSKKKSLTKSIFGDWVEFGCDIGLKEIGIDKLRKDIIEILKLNKINYLENLNKITIEGFRNIVKKNPELEYYFFYILKVQIWEIDKIHIKSLGNDIGLKNNNISDKKKIKEINYYLKTKGINNYDDLINKYVVREIRELLWNNDLSRDILNSFGLMAVKDFRKSYIIRFAKRIGLDGI